MLSEVDINNLIESIKAKISRLRKDVTGDYVWPCQFDDVDLKEFENWVHGEEDKKGSNWQGSYYRLLWLLDGSFPGEGCAYEPESRVKFRDFEEVTSLMRVLEPLRQKGARPCRIELKTNDRTNIHMFYCSELCCPGYIEVLGGRNYTFDGEPLVDVLRSNECTCPKAMNNSEERMGMVKAPSKAELCRKLTIFLVNELYVPVCNIRLTNPPVGFVGNKPGAEVLYENDNSYATPLIEVRREFRRARDRTLSKWPDNFELSLAENREPNVDMIHPSHIFFQLHDGTWYDIPVVCVSSKSRLEEEWMPLVIEDPRTAARELLGHCDKGECYHIAASEKIEMKLHNNFEQIWDYLKSENYSACQNGVAIKRPHRAKVVNCEGVTDANSRKRQALSLPEQAGVEDEDMCGICLSQIATVRLCCTELLGRPSFRCPGALVCHECKDQLTYSRRPDSALKDSIGNFLLDNRKTQYVSCLYNCNGKVKYFRSPPDSPHLSRLDIPKFFLVERPIMNTDELLRASWAFDYYCTRIAESRRELSQDIESAQYSIDSFRGMSEATSDYSAIQLNHFIALKEAQLKQWKLLLRQTKYPTWATDWTRRKEVPSSPPATHQVEKGMSNAAARRLIGANRRVENDYLSCDICGMDIGFDPIGKGWATLLPKPHRGKVYYFALEAEQERRDEFDKEAENGPTTSVSREGNRRRNWPSVPSHNFVLLDYDENSDADESEA
jgi:hypothetical protein